MKNYEVHNEFLFVMRHRYIALAHAVVVQP